MKGSDYVRAIDTLKKDMQRKLSVAELVEEAREIGKGIDKGPIELSGDGRAVQVWVATRAGAIVWTPTACRWCRAASASRRRR